MPKIWIALPPPIWHNGTGLSTEFYRQTVIPTIKEVANKTGLPLINVYEAVFDHPEFFPDGVHPNSKGSGLIASAVYKALISKST
jgi:lysophospholipase L1-like esterase